MKITPALIKLFEKDQDEHGTKLAIRNLLWLKYTGDLADIGVTRVRTTTKVPKGYTEANVQHR